MTQTSAPRAAIEPDGVRRAWQQVPRPEENRLGRPRWMTELAAVVVTLAGPVARAAIAPDARVATVAPIAVAALVAGGVLGSRRWALRIAAAVVAGVAVAVANGPLLGLWTAGAVALADWAVRRWPPAPGFRRPPATAIVPALAFTALGVWRGLDGDSGYQPLIVVAMALVVTWSSTWRGDPVGRTLRTGVAWFGVVVARALFAVLALWLVVLVWLVHRIARAEPFGGAPTDSGWSPRERRSVRAERPWADDRPQRTALWPRVRTSVVWLLLIAVPVVLLVRSQPGAGTAGFDLLGSSDRSGGWWDEPDTIPAAYAGADWYPEYRRDIEWVMNQAVAFRPLDPVRVQDVATPLVNVKDGVRRTWRPPACSCRRLSVWVYGGSTIFGIGQRDDFTIPSALAKVAWDAGVALDVTNRGVPGDLHWQEANRLAWDLTREPAPDLVIFYDGANEIWATGDLVNTGRGDTRAPSQPLTDLVWNQLMDRYGTDAPKAPSGGRLAPTTTVATTSPTQFGALAVERYERSRQISRDIAVARDLRVEWFWQPVRLSRPAVDGEPDDGDAERDGRIVAETAAAGLSPDVHDLSHVFDSSPRPLFSDDAHHNEEGARLAAQSIYATAIAPIASK